MRLGMYNLFYVTNRANSLLCEMERSMVDGNYAIYVDTLLGRQPGSVTLRTEGAKTYADINAPVIGKQFIEVKVGDDNTFEAEGTFWLMLMGMIRYYLRGEVEGDDLHILIQSTKGKFDTNGKRA